MYPGSTTIKGVVSLMLASTLSLMSVGKSMPSSSWLKRPIRRLGVCLGLGLCRQGLRLLVFELVVVSVWPAGDATA